MKIPYNKLYLTGEEIENISDSLKRGDIGGNGYYTSLNTKYIEESFNIKKAYMVNSATQALEAAMMLIGINEGDEVIMPSFTFPSTANAVMLRGGTPVFAEIDENLNISPESIEANINSKTKAIIPVHYAGIGCKMDTIMEIAKKNNLFVIEDAAQGVNASYKGKYLGSWGHFSCFSFHSTKNYTAGEGGALCINIDNNSLIDNFEIIRHKGTNRNKFLKGEVEKYWWCKIGSNYTPSDILMAMLYAQLNQIENITEKRKSIFLRYSSAVEKFVKEGLIKKIVIPDECEINYHLFYILFQKKELRDKVKDLLNKEGVNAVIHFVPLHSSPMGLSLGYQKDQLPYTQKVSDTLLRLPLYPNMSGEQVEYVINKLTYILEGL